MIYPSDIGYGVRDMTGRVHKQTHRTSRYIAPRCWEETPGPLRWMPVTSHTTRSLTVCDVCWPRGLT